MFENRAVGLEVALGSIDMEEEADLTGGQTVVGIPTKNAHKHLHWPACS
jgi:hypothetical protein